MLTAIKNLINGSIFIIALFAVAATGFWLWEHNRAYYLVVSEQNEETKRCASFKPEVFNRTLLEALTANALESILPPKLSHFNDAPPNSVLANGIKILSDQNALTKGFYQSGLLDRNITQIKVLYGFDKECRLTNLRVASGSKNFSFIVSDKSTFGELSRSIVEHTDQFYFIRKSVERQPSYARGLALAKVLQGSYPAHYANLVAISYMLEARQLPDAALKREKYALAIAWFDRSLAYDRSFMPAIINRTQARIRQSQYSATSYDEAIREIMRAYFIYGNVGYLPAAAVVLREIIATKERSGLQKAASELQLAQSVLETEIRLAGPSRTSLDTLYDVYVRRAEVERVAGHADEAANLSRLGRETFEMVAALDVDAKTNPINRLLQGGGW